MAIEHLTFSLILILTDFNFSVNSHTRPGATILEDAILENVGVNRKPRPPAFKEQLWPLPPPFVSTDTPGLEVPRHTVLRHVSDLLHVWFPLKKSSLPPLGLSIASPENPRTPHSREAQPFAPVALPQAPTGSSEGHKRLEEQAGGDIMVG